MTAKAMKTFTLGELAEHNKPGDMYIAIAGKVYDISKFARMHPGGERILASYAGKDATEIFFELHRTDVLGKYERLVVGALEGAVPVPQQAFSEIPYAEPMFMQDYHSPYYTAGHIQLKNRLRAHYQEHFAKECAMLDAAGKVPSAALMKRVAKAGTLAACLGPGPWMKGLDIFGIKGEDFDAFHEMVFHQEFTRLGSQGFCDGLGGGLGIGLPPVAYFAPMKLKMKVLKEVLTGEKRICLAISEPYVGSDVAQLKCTAEKTPCGKYYVVNGEKKWITGGLFADYFVTAVRTGGKGMGGISMLLVPRTEGVVTKQISTSYSPSAGTSYIMFTDVKVPVENLLGQENKGFMCIMVNFNHERWTMIVTLAERCRIMVEECFRWAAQRNIFGKKLIDMPVIRAKLADMATQAESLQHWCDALTHQMNKLPFKEQARRLAGPIALCKYHSTRVSLKIADHAAQVFGGRSLTKSGMGIKVEQFISAVKFSAILGGSEEVLADFAVRQAQKQMSKTARL